MVNPGNHSVLFGYMTALACCVRAMSPSNPGLLHAASGSAYSGPKKIPARPLAAGEGGRVSNKNVDPVCANTGEIKASVKARKEVLMAHPFVKSEI
jgi:hypothetical protein